MKILCLDTDILYLDTVQHVDSTTEFLISDVMGKMEYKVILFSTYYPASAVLKSPSI